MGRRRRVTHVTFLYFSYSFFLRQLFINDNQQHLRGQINQIRL